MEAGHWNWLEVAKLVAGLLTPIALAIFGIYIHRVTKRFEDYQWRSQKLVEKRLAVYDDLAPLFNDLLCYFTYVGSWRDINPQDVVKLKRLIDKKLHLAAPLFGAEFFSACMAFQEICYETYRDWGQDASLRTHVSPRREAYQKDWVPEWEECFSTNISSPSEVHAAYKRVMEAFAQDIGVHPTLAFPASRRIPVNVC